MFQVIINVFCKLKDKISYLTKKIRIIKTPIKYTLILGISLIVSEYLLRSRIWNSFVIAIVSIMYLCAVVFENESKSLLHKVTNFTLFTLVASPLIVYIIVLMMKTISPTLEIIGNQTAWISFYGSLIGGSLVMFALIFTMQNEETIRQDQKKYELEKRKQELMPIIDFDFEINQNGVITHDKNRSTLISKIINRSQAHAIIKKINILSFSYIHNDRVLREINDGKSGNFPNIYTLENQILAGKSSKDLLFMIPIYEELLDVAFDENNNEIEIQLFLEIIYSDIQNLQSYGIDLQRIILLSFEYESYGEKYEYKLSKIQTNDTIRNL